MSKNAYWCAKNTWLSNTNVYMTSLHVYNSCSKFTLHGVTYKVKVPSSFNGKTLTCYTLHVGL